MKIILTRHGQTEENIAGIIQGHSRGKLSNKGLEDAKKLALRLKDEKIDYIYSSDLERSVDTAKEIAKFHPQTPIKFIKEMRERDPREFTGKRKVDVGIAPKKLVALWLETKDGETVKEMHERAKKFLEFLKKKHTDDTVLLVGHNGINLSIYASMMAKSLAEIRALEDTRSASISIFETYKTGKFRTVLFNSTKHLE